jgi:1-acyl-sn-glycerol-3-phosphate acyltransferase
MTRYKSPNDSADYRLIEDFDPTLVHNVAKWYLPVLEKYYRAEFIGLDNIPDGPFLGVGNHTGIHYMPESYLWLCKYHSNHEHRPMYTLVHDFVYKVAEKLRLPLHALGILDADKGSAYEALREGCAVTVYPAGDRDNAKPFYERNEIDFFGHTGYVKLALNARVPIVPVVGVGGGESVFTLTSGSGFAEWSGLKKYLKIHTWPVFWSFPFGWHVGHFPTLGLPLPTQVTVSVLEPIDTSGYAEDAANDPLIIAELNAKVLHAMQAEVDRLVKGRIPVIGRIGKK